MSKLRVFFIPVERQNSLQVGFRNTLEILRQGNIIEDYEIFSLTRVQEEIAKQAAILELISAIKRFKPNFLLLQKPEGTGLKFEDFTKMLVGAPFFVYHEGDPYSRFLHPLPRESRLAAKFSSVTYVVGSGMFKSNMVRAGANDVRWLPHAYEPSVFELNEKPGKQHQVIIIANKNQPRLRGLPGWRDRISFVELLSKELGEGLAIYGKGWELPQSKGSIPYESQIRVNSSAQITANWDHFPKEPGYFSDRLPISLASNAVHATTNHPLYSEFFGLNKPFLVGDTPRELLVKILRQLEKSETQNTNLIKSANNFADRHLRQDDQLIKILSSFDSNLSNVKPRRLSN